MHELHIGARIHQPPTITQYRLMLRTRTLIIRAFEETDRNKLLPLLMDPAFMENSLTGALDAMGAVQRFKQILQLNRIGLGKQALIEAHSGELVGYCGIEPFELYGELKLELGFRIVPRYRGLGYATEAARELANRHIGDLHAMTDASNEAARLVLQRAGFVHQGQCVVDDLTWELYEHLIRETAPREFASLFPDD